MPQVKVALAAGEAAGIALAGGQENLARVQDDDLSAIADFAKEACAEAGGSPREQNVAARTVVIRCAKAKGFTYKIQQETADKHAGLSFSEVDEDELEATSKKAKNINMALAGFGVKLPQSSGLKGAFERQRSNRGSAGNASVSNVDTAAPLRPHESLL